MKDLSKYKPGDILTLEITTTVIPNHPHHESHDFERTQIVADFKLLHNVKRGEEFILIFERSEVFDGHGFEYDSKDESYIFINSFILDSRDLEFGYIKFLDKEELQRQNNKKINLLKKSINTKEKQIQRDLINIEDFKIQLEILKHHANSLTSKFVTKNIYDLKAQIKSNTEEIEKLHVELSKTSTMEQPSL